MDVDKFKTFLDTTLELDGFLLVHLNDEHGLKVTGVASHDHHNIHSGNLKFKLTCFVPSIPH